MDGRLSTPRRRTPIKPSPPPSGSLSGPRFPRYTALRLPAPPRSSVIHAERVVDGRLSTPRRRAPIKPGPPPSGSLSGPRFPRYTALRLPAPRRVSVIHAERVVDGRLSTPRRRAPLELGTCSVSLTVGPPPLPTLHGSWLPSAAAHCGVPRGTGRGRTAAHASPYRALELDPPRRPHSESPPLPALPGSGPPNAASQFGVPRGTGRGRAAGSPRRRAPTKTAPFSVALTLGDAASRAIRALGFPAPLRTSVFHVERVVDGRLPTPPVVRRSNGDYPPSPSL